MEPRQWDDEQLLSDLAEALRSAGPLDAATAAGRAAFDWRSIDDELALATLVFDSRVDELAVTRGATATPRMLVFETASAAIEIEVADGMLTGEVTPAAAGTVELRAPDGSVVHRADVDELGRFTLPAPDDAPARLCCRAGEVEVLTEWVSRWG